MNEDQYINPIIQGMIRSANLDQERRRLAQEGEQHKADTKIRQQLADQAEEQIKNTKEHNQSLIDIQKEREKLAHEEHGLNISKFIRENIASGGTFQKTPDISTGGVAGLPSVIPGAGNSNFMDQNIQPGQYAGPEQLIKNKIGALTAEETAKMPFQFQLLKAHYENSKGLQESAQEFQNKIEDKKELANKLKDKFDKETQLQIVGLTNASHEKIANLTHGITPEQTQSGIIQAMTGMRKFTSDNPYDRNIMQQVQQAGGRPLDPKEVDTLKQLNGLNSTFDKIEDFINTELPSEKKEGSFTAKTKAYVKGLAAKTGLPLDVTNKFNAIKTGAIDIGRGLEGLTGGRILAKQLDLDLNGLTSPGITKEMGQVLLNNLKDRYVNKEQNVIMGGLPDIQKQMIIKQYGIKQPESNSPGTLPMGIRPTGILPPSIRTVTRDPKTGELIFQ
jgi:hypothetical protein